MSEMLEKKPESRGGFYGIAKFLAWLGTCLAICLLLILFRDILSSVRLSGTESAGTIGKIIQRLIDFWPNWMVVGWLATLKIVTHIATIRGTVKFTLEWFLFCVLLISLAGIGHETIWGLIGSTPFGGMLIWPIEGGLVGVFIGYGIWGERQGSIDTIQQVSDLFGPINRQSLRYIMWGALIGANVALLGELLSIGGVPALMLVVIPSVAIGALIRLGRPSVRIDAGKRRSTLTNALMVTCLLSAIGLLFADLGWWAIGLILLAITIGAAVVVDVLNSPYRESGGQE